MMRNMCFRIESIGVECFCHRALPRAGRFCPFRAKAKAARRYRHPGCYPGLTALWPFRPWADSFRPWADSFRAWADSFLPRLMSGEIKVGDVTL